MRFEGAVTMREWSRPSLWLEREGSHAPLRVRDVSPTELDAQLPVLVDLLRDTVNGGGTPMGFLPPLGYEESLDYWLAVRRELEIGTRVLLAAYLGDRIVGVGQLALASMPNARHRAEVQKLFVGSELRARGIGAALLGALHDVAQARGRRLLLLTARRGSPAERFYRRLGYREVGVVPGYTLGPNGERHDNVMLYYELAAQR